MKCHLHPSTGCQCHRSERGSPWVLSVAWRSQVLGLAKLSLEGTALLQAGHGCKEGLAPQDTPPFFHSHQERSPVLKHRVYTLAFAAPWRALKAAPVLEKTRLKRKKKRKPTSFLQYHAPPLPQTLNFPLLPTLPRFPPPF